MSVSPQNIDADMVWLDDIAAGTIIMPGSPGSIHIPDHDLEQLTNEQRRIIFAKVKQITMPQELSSRLENITPPPMSDEEELSWHRSSEAEARIELELNGCPPCYPADFEVPLDTSLSEPHFSASKAFEDTSEFPFVLGTQLCEWKRFRKYQKRARYKFVEYVSQLRSRREGQGLPRQPELEADIEKQDALQTWTEYQDFNLRELASHEAEKSRTEQELDRKIRGVAQAHTKTDIFRLNAKLVSLADRVKECSLAIEKRILLKPWIEWQRSRLAESETGNDNASIKIDKEVLSNAISHNETKSTHEHRTQEVKMAGLSTELSSWQSLRKRKRSEDISVKRSRFRSEFASEVVPRQKYNLRAATDRLAREEEPSECDIIDNTTSTTRLTVWNRPRKPEGTRHSKRIASRKPVYYA